MRQTETDKLKYDKCICYNLLNDYSRKLFFFKVKKKEKFKFVAVEE